MLRNISLYHCNKILIIFLYRQNLNLIYFVSLIVALKSFPLVFSNNNPFNHKNHSNSTSMDSIYVTYLLLSLLAITQEHLPHLKARSHLV